MIKKSFSSRVKNPFVSLTLFVIPTNEYSTKKKKKEKKRRKLKRRLNKKIFLNFSFEKRPFEGARGSL